MNLLQITLLGNALFSLFTGLSLILFSQPISGWFDQQNSTLFRIIGIGLVLFSFTVFIQVKNPKAKSVFYIVVQDIVWVLASVILLITDPYDISVFGNQMIAGVALIVLLFGIGQSAGISRIDSIRNTGIKQLSVERTVEANQSETWKLISDVENYHHVAPNIDHSKIISGRTEGMIRQCSHGKDQWTETCTLWSEGEKYSFEVNTNAPDYPYPLQYLKGTWMLEKVSPAQTKILMIFELQYKRNIYNFFLHPFLRKEFHKICNTLLDNWEKMLIK